MPIQIRRVKPGDLIESAYFDEIADYIEQLDRRLAALEGKPVASPVTITGLSSPDIEEGGTLTVRGTGFGMPAENTVTLDAIHRIDSFLTGSNDWQLVFGVPTIGAPPEGRIVTLLIGNSRGSASTNLTVRAPQPQQPEGRLEITLVGAPTIGPGTNVLRYTVRAITNMTETYRLSLAPPAGWTASISDALGNAAPTEISIPRNQDVSVFVKLTVPSGTGSGSLTLTVTSKRNPTGITQTNRTTLTIGAQPSTPSFSIALDSPFTGGVVEVTAGQRTAVRFIANMTDPAKAPAGTYVVKGPTVKDAAGWTAELRLVSGGTEFTVDGPGSPTIPIALTGTATAAETDLTLRVELKGQESKFFGEITPRIRVKR